MSIFKATFKPYIARQINTRQNLLKQPDKRGPALQKYVSAKSPWIKMTSLVNYNESIDLAKKYVLMGGTLVPDPNDASNTFFGMRSGINNNQGAYGSNLGSRQYGIRPMPGIASADIKSKSAYGSLREATVKYYAWDKVQQDELSILFQTPGFAVILEWGWSMYLDTSKPGEQYDSISDNQSIKAFSDFNMVTTEPATIDCFASSITPNSVYENIEKLRHKYSGNYDAMLGFIRNFEWQLMPGGGYECTVVLISIGDVLDTLKMNSFTGNENLKDGANTTDKTNLEYKDEFETLLTRYASITDESSRNGMNDILAIDTLITEQNLTGILDNSIYEIASTGTPSISSPFVPMLEKTKTKYMQFGFLIYIINNTRNLFLDGKEKIVDIEIPLPNVPKNRGTGLCVASKYSITINLSSCLIKNSKADIFTSLDLFSGIPNITGFIPTTNVYGKRVNLKNEYLYGNDTLGTIGNVYVNIGQVLSLYKAEQKKNNGTVYVGKYIRSILEDISFSLGSINNFDIYVEDSKAIIIDKAYTELPSESQKANKFILNLAGTDTIVRSHVIKSKIFPSQATMIAIGAGNAQNLGSVQTSTYNYINTGLTSRLYTNMTDVPNQDISEENKLALIYLNNIIKLTEYVNNFIILGSTNGNNADAILNTMNTYLNTLLVKIVEDTNYKAIIPISLEATIDGIGGVTIGEIFTVNKDILPKQYQDRSIGFIVTGISNNITRPDWTTTISTQICLLDQENFKGSISDSYRNVKSSLNDLILSRIQTLKNYISIYNVLAAFYCDMIRGSFVFEARIPDLKSSTMISIKYKSDAEYKDLLSTLNENPLVIDSIAANVDIIFEEMAKSFSGYVSQKNPSGDIIKTRDILIPLNDVNSKDKIICIYISIRFLIVDYIIIWEEKY